MKKQDDKMQRSRAMVRELKKLFKDKKPTTTLSYTTPWKLLVAVILSAQCTDKRVNEVTKSLFKKYKTLDDYILARKSEFEQDIKSTGFYKNKTKNILATAQKIKKEFGGTVPDSMEQLITLPGVAHKTANVVLCSAFGKTEGIAVDTHVRRFAIRFDLTDSKNPDRIEKDLMELLPKKDWCAFSHYLIYYGREVCSAHKHACEDHPLTKLYPQAAHNWPRSK